MQFHLSTVLIQIILQDLFMFLWLIFQSDNPNEVEHGIQWSSSMLKLTCANAFGSLFIDKFALALWQISVYIDLVLIKF